MMSKKKYTHFFPLYFDEIIFMYVNIYRYIVRPLFFVRTIIRHRISNWWFIFIIMCNMLQTIHSWDLSLVLYNFLCCYEKKNEKITMFIRKTDKNFSYRLPSWRRSCWNLNNILLHRVHHSHLHNSRNLFCLLCCIINKISKKQLKSNNFLEQNQRE